jgi:hypothetical protein
MHTLCCAKGAASKGHNLIRDHLFNLALASDYSTRMEQCSAAAIGGAGLRRPADILTSATPWGSAGSAALDIGVSCPHAQDAIVSNNIDHLDLYRKKKLDKYKKFGGPESWLFLPLIISSYGRPHPDFSKAIAKLAKAAARRYGSDQSKIENAWWRRCGSLLAIRAAMMVERCRPAQTLPHGIGDEIELAEADDPGDGRAMEHVISMPPAGGIDDPSVAPAAGTAIDDVTCA